jgi:hypothetical protein
MNTAVEQLIDEFNEELKVAIEIGNSDKIRTIKHLITIATSYLPMEKEQMIEFASKGIHRNSCFFNIEEYYETFKQQEQ